MSRVGVLFRVTVRKHVEVLGPPTLTPSLNILFGCMGFFLGGGEGKREEGRVKHCWNNVCFCSSFFVDRINVLA